MFPTSFDPDLLAYLTPEELAELDLLIVSDPTVWRPLPGPQSLALAGQGRLDGFGGAGTGRDDQLSRQGRVLGAERVVGRLVQLDAVPLLVRPTVGRDHVEARRGLGQRRQKHAALLGGWPQSDPDRSLHAHILPDFAASRRACERRSIPPPAKAGGLLERFR